MPEETGTPLSRSAVQQINQVREVDDHMLMLPEEIGNANTRVIFGVKGQNDRFAISGANVTPADTDMLNGSKLAEGQNKIVKQIFFYMPFTITLDDIRAIMTRSMVTLTVNNRKRCSFPLRACGSGPQVQYFSNEVAAPAQFQLTHGLPFTLRNDLELKQNIPFQLMIDWPAAITLAATRICAFGLLGPMQNPVR